MPPTTSSRASQEQAFDITQITALEEQEERRVREQLAGFADAEAAERRTLADELRAAESHERDTGERELTRWEAERLPEVIRSGEEDRKDRVRAVETSYRKAAPAVVSALVDRLVDGDLLS